MPSLLRHERLPARSSAASSRTSTSCGGGSRRTRRRCSRRRIADAARVGRAAVVPGRTRPAEGAAPDARVGARRRRAGARGRRRRDLPRPDAAARADRSAAARARPTSWSRTAPRSRCPRRFPGCVASARRVVRGAAAVVAAGGYPARQASRIAGRDVPGVVVPPGVDAERFRPVARRRARRVRALKFGLDPDRPLVLGSVAARAAQGLRRGDRRGRGPARRAARDRGCGPRPGAARATSGSPRRRRARFSVGLRIADLPALYGCADVFAMCCRDRWGGARGGGVRHRLPRSRRVRGSGGGRPQRRRARSRRRRGDRVRRRAPRRRRGPGRARPRCATIRRCGRAWAARRGSGRSGSTPTTGSSRACCR